MSLLYQLIIALILCSAGTQILKTFFKFVVTGKINTKTLFADGDFPSSHSSFVSAIAVIAWIRVYNISIQNLNTDDAIFIAILATAFACITIRDALGVRHTVEVLCESCRKIISSNKDTLTEINSKIPELDKTVTKDIQENFESLAKILNIKSGHLPHEVVGGVFWGTLIAIATSSYYYGFYNYFIISIFAIFAYIVIMTIFLKYGFKFQKAKKRELQ